MVEFITSIVLLSVLISPYTIILYYLHVIIIAGKYK